MIALERPREGWSVVNEQGETVALDLELTPELVRAGLAREAIRAIQEARKTSGLDITDRIELRWSANGEVAEAVRAESDLVAREVLAVSMDEGDPSADAVTTDLGLTFSIFQGLASMGVADVAGPTSATTWGAIRLRAIQSPSRDGIEP